MAVFTNLNELSPEPVDMEGASRVSKRVLLGEEQGVPNFIMRVFEIEPGGHTPKHTHPYEHEIFVLSGHGEVVLESGSRRLKPNDSLLVFPDELHQFRNPGGEVFRFMCLIPRQEG